MLPYLVVIALILVFFVWPAWRNFRREEAEARQAWENAREAGRHEPTSIRPWVNVERCMGSGACIAACPEKKILQVIDGQARLVNATACVGHGACEAACPVQAIELVFGSERRGVAIPQVSPEFQTNVPGIYIAGELGGMGLIANAVEQGTRALSHLQQGLGPKPEGGVDLVIVGAGPAGIAAGLEAKKRGLSYMLIEQEEFGGAIRHYPRQKMVMSRGFELPGCNPIPPGTLSKEELIEHLSEQVRQQDLKINERERVEAVDPLPGGGFTVRTSKREMKSSSVLLTVGRRGTPRRLNVAGEDSAKVAYRLIDPELYQHAHILVVGGGDSAVEAACALSEQTDNRVALSYRRATINRPKADNQKRLQEAAEAGRVQLLLPSQVKEIGVDRVHIDHDGEELVLPNDYVFVFAGGVLPTKFLQSSGVKMQQHFGKRVEEL